MSEIKNNKIENTQKPTKTQINNELQALWNENFTPIIEEAKKNMNSMFNDKSYVLKNDVKIPSKYKFEIKSYDNKNIKHIDSMIKQCEAPNFTDFIQNYKFYFLKTLKYAINENLSFTTINNYIKYFTVIFRDLKLYYEQSNHADKNELILIFEQIHTYFKNLLSTFNAFITDYTGRKNKLNDIEKQNYMPFPEILKIYEKLPNITYQDHIKKLLMGLYVLDTPVRMEALDLIFITDEKYDNKKDDFILIQPQINKITMIYNKSKKRHNDIKYELKNQELKDLIFDSYFRYPRLHVITSIKNKDLNVSIIQKNTYFKLIDPKIGINMIRSSYFTYNLPLYNNYNEASNDAYKARTSVNNIMKNYNKKCLNGLNS